MQIWRLRACALIEDSVKARMGFQGEVPRAFAVEILGDMLAKCRRCEFLMFDMLAQCRRCGEG